MSAPGDVPHAEESTQILEAIRAGLGGGCKSPMEGVLHHLKQHADLTVEEDVITFKPWLFERGPMDHFLYELTDHRFLGDMVNTLRKHTTQRDAYAQAAVIAHNRNPKVIFVNHRVAAHAMADRFPDVSLVINIPDFGKPHWGWMIQHLRKEGSRDFLLVSNKESHDFAVSCGVPKERIRISGYPVRPEFEAAREMPKGPLRREYGLPEEAKVVSIISGGGRWNPDVCAALQDLALTGDARAQGMHVVVVTGGDAQIAAEATRIAGTATSGIHIHVMSQRLDAESMAKIMRMSSLNAIKYGGGAIGESHAVRVPFVGYDELSGIEHRNRDDVIQRKTGIDARTKAKFLEAVLSFDEESAEAYLVEQDKLQVPGSAKWIADFLRAQATGGPEPAPRFPADADVAEAAAAV